MRAAGPVVASDWEISDEAICAVVTSGLSQAFAGVSAWYGLATGSWWAYVPLPGGGRLVEAIDPAELRKAIISANAWPWPYS